MHIDDILKSNPSSQELDRIILMSALNSLLNKKTTMLKILEVFGSKGTSLVDSKKSSNALHQDVQVVQSDYKHITSYFEGFFESHPKYLHSDLSYTSYTRDNLNTYAYNILDVLLVTVANTIVVSPPWSHINHMCSEFFLPFFYRLDLDKTIVTPWFRLWGEYRDPYEVATSRTPVIIPARNICIVLTEEGEKLRRTFEGDERWKRSD